MMMVKDAPKAFVRYLHIFHHNVRSAEAFAEDKRLTIQEKNILSAWFLIRKNKYQEAISLMLKTSHSSCAFVDAQKDLVLGICLNNIGRLPEAQQLLTAALEKLQSQQIRSMDFISYYNLFICCYNLRDKERASFIITHLADLNPENDRQKIMLLQCELMFHTMTMNIEAAKRNIQMLDRVASKMSESMLIGHIYDKMDFYLGIDDFKSCYECLDEFKTKRSFLFPENLIFLRTILEHLLFDRPIYVYPTQFPENKDLYNQLKYLQALVSQDSIGRERFWKALQARNPEMFLEGEVYQNENSLFGKVLKKYAKSKVSYTFSLSNDSKEKLLYQLIMESPVPMNKEQLFKLLWGREMQDKSEMSKLKKLVSKVRSKYNIDISYKQSCYSLHKKISQVS